MGCQTSSPESDPKCGQKTSHHSRSSSLNRSQSFVNRQGLILSRTPPGTGPRKPLERSQSERHKRSLTYCGVQVFPVFTPGGITHLEIPVVDDTRLDIKQSTIKRIKTQLNVPIISRERASTDERRKRPTKIEHQRTPSFEEELDSRMLELRQKNAMAKSEKFQNKSKT